MTTTFRTSKELDELLSAAARITGKRRSEIIRDAVSHYCRQIVMQEKGTWRDVLMESGFQPVSSGVKDLATNKQHLKSAMDERLKRSTD